MFIYVYITGYILISFYLTFMTESYLLFLEVQILYCNVMSYDYFKCIPASITSILTEILQKARI